MHDTAFQVLRLIVVVASSMSVVSVPVVAQTGHGFVRTPAADSPATPNISPTGGSYNGSVLVTITDTDASVPIRFTIDGSNPAGANAVTYSGPFNLTHSATVLAIAIGKNNSNISQQPYTIVPVTPTPAISPTIIPTPGTPIKIYTGPTTVSISDPMPGAIIRFTLDATNPLTSNTAQTYRGPFVLNPAFPLLWYGVVTAAAVAPGYAPSGLAASSFEVLPYGPAPIIMPPSGTYPPGTTVTISGPTPSAWVAYTIDGSDPLKYGNWTAKPYNRPFTVSANTTVRAAVAAWPNNALNGGQLTSLEAQAVYTISTNAPTPVQIISATPTVGTVQLGFISSAVGTAIDKISNQYSYRVYEALSATGPFAPVAAAVAINPAVAAASANLRLPNPPPSIVSARAARTPSVAAPVAPPGSATVTGLTNGVTYYFFITATSIAAGWTSTPSNIISAVPGGALGPELTFVNPQIVDLARTSSTGLPIWLGGAGFDAGAVTHIVISGIDTALPTTYQNAGALQAVIPGSLLPATVVVRQPAAIYVQNPGNSYRSHNQFINIAGPLGPVRMTSCAITKFASQGDPSDGLSFTLVNSGPASAQLSYSTVLVFNGGYNDVGHIFGAWALQESNPAPPFLTAHGPYSLAAGMSQTFTVAIFDPGLLLAGLSSYTAEAGNPPWLEVYYSLASPLPSPIDYSALMSSGIARATLAGCIVAPPTKFAVPIVPSLVPQVPPTPALPMPHN